jgi:hypothetical protein
MYEYNTNSFWNMVIPVMRCLRPVLDHHPYLLFSDHGQFAGASTLMLASDLGFSEHRNRSEGTSDARTDSSGGRLQ